MNQVNNKINPKQQERKLTQPVANSLFAKPRAFLNRFAASKKPSLSLLSHQPIQPNIKYESRMVSRNSLHGAISSETKSNVSSKKVSFPESIYTSGPPSSSQSYQPELPSPITTIKPSTSSSRTPVSSQSIRNVDVWTCSSQSSQRRGTRGTKSSGSATTSSNPSRVIVAITEGRGNSCGEVGLAAMDVRHPCLIMCQLSDAHNYYNTTAKLNVLNPDVLLLPNTIVDKGGNSKLLQTIQKKFPGVEQKSLHRKFYNDKEGINAVKSLHLPECSSIELLVVRKYFTLAAAAALVKYVEYVENVTLASQSVPMEYRAVDKMMMIDFDTMDNLELILSQSNNCEARSLLGVLNRCFTFGGKRRLRSAILQPSFIEEDLNRRLDCVTELAGDIDLHKSIMNTLAKIPDVDALLKICFIPVNRKQDDSSVTMINYVILLKTIIDIIPSLYDILKTTKTKYFEKLTKSLMDPRLEDLASEIDKVLEKDTARVKGYAASQFQRCFAIKPDVNGLLDVARYTYSNLVAEFQTKVAELVEQYELPLRCQNTSSKGFHITMSVAGQRDFSVKNLPKVFIQAQRRKNVVTMTTEDLIFMNERIKQALQEVQLMSNAVLQTLIQKIRENTGCLYNLCDSVAELDVIVCLARVSSNIGYVRPVFGSKLALKNARHPILDFTNSSVPVGNDVMATDLNNFHIITGPNMGGKSIFIKQIALIQILAQIGCYVPAEEAEVRLVNNLFSRISFDDSIECNASHFTLELKEMDHILRSTNQTSLVIIDEFCRGTAVDEGTAIAWATCEVFIHSTVHTFFATHFHLLSRLKDLYPQVSCWYFDAEIITPQDNSRPRLNFTHKLLPGVVSIENYGLKLAESTGLPEHMKEAANKLAETLTETKKQSLNHYISNEAKKEAELDEFCMKLLTMVDTDQLTLETLGTELEVCNLTEDSITQLYGSNEKDQDQPMQDIPNSPTSAPGSSTATRTHDRETTFDRTNFLSDEDSNCTQTTQETTILLPERAHSIQVKSKSQALASLQQYNSSDSNASDTDSEKSTDSLLANYKITIYGADTINTNRQLMNKSKDVSLRDESPRPANTKINAVDTSFSGFATPDIYNRSSTPINSTCWSSARSRETSKTGEEFCNRRELGNSRAAPDQVVPAKSSLTECRKTRSSDEGNQEERMHLLTKRPKIEGSNFEAPHKKTALNHILSSTSIMYEEVATDLEDATHSRVSLRGTSTPVVDTSNSILMKDSECEETIKRPIGSNPLCSKMGKSDWRSPSAYDSTEESYVKNKTRFGPMVGGGHEFSNSECSANSPSILSPAKTHRRDKEATGWRQTGDQTISSEHNTSNLSSRKISCQNQTPAKTHWMDKETSGWRQTGNQTICSEHDTSDLLPRKISAQNKSRLHPTLHEVSLTSQCSSRPGSAYHDERNFIAFDNDGRKVFQRQNREDIHGQHSLNNVKAMEKSLHNFRLASGNFNTEHVTYYEEPRTLKRNQNMSVPGMDCSSFDFDKELRNLHQDEETNNESYYSCGESFHSFSEKFSSPNLQLLPHEVSIEGQKNNRAPQIFYHPRLIRNQLDITKPKFVQIIQSAVDQPAQNRFQLNAEQPSASPSSNLQRVNLSEHQIFEQSSLNHSLTNNFLMDTKQDDSRLTVNSFILTQESQKLFDNANS